MATTFSVSPQEQQKHVWHELLNHNNYSSESEAEQESSDDTAAATSTAAASTSDDSQLQQKSLREWPSYDHVMGDMADADYNHTLTCPFDVVKNQAETSGCSKTICAHGAVCCAKLELFSLPDNYAGTIYTGLLEPASTSEHCILRLSSAMKPPNLEMKSTWARALLYATGEKLRNAKLFPTAALKVFRDKGVRSGNLLFGGSKIGQREADYFAHCMCTSMTEQMPRGVKPFVRKFWKYSDYPLSLGTSDFCTHKADGTTGTSSSANTTTTDQPEFPFALILRPRVATAVTAASPDANTPEPPDAALVDSFDAFLDGVLSTPVGTVLFDVFACPDPFAVPDPSKLQRIGRVTTTSKMIQSAPSDGLFFRHQKKEEDYALKPGWRQALKTQVTIDQGNTKGTIGRLAGWKLFEQHIKEESYEDFEREFERQI